jgi:hypothetical protein
VVTSDLRDSLEVSAGLVGDSGSGEALYPRSTHRNHCCEISPEADIVLQPLAGRALSAFIQPSLLDLFEKEEDICNNKYRTN